jgi:hypothetical protein
MEPKAWAAAGLSKLVTEELVMEEAVAVTEKEAVAVVVEEGIVTPARGFGDPV